MCGVFRGIITITPIIGCIASGSAMSSHDLCINVSGFQHVGWMYNECGAAFFLFYFRDSHTYKDMS